MLGKYELSLKDFVEVLRINPRRDERIFLLASLCCKSKVSLVFVLLN